MLPLPTPPQGQFKNLVDEIALLPSPVSVGEEKLLLESKISTKHLVLLGAGSQGDQVATGTMSVHEEDEVVRLETSMGTIEVELYTQHAPVTSRNFKELALRGYYDNTIFHRVIKDFMVQGGDPTGTGKGGESAYGGKFEDEASSLRTLKHVGAGVLSMANAGPNTNGSQFFVTLAPTPHLDGKHAIFGRVRSGMGVVERMGSVVTDRNDRPTTDVRIIRASVV